MYVGDDKLITTTEELFAVMFAAAELLRHLFSLIYTLDDIIEWEHEYIVLARRVLDGEKFVEVIYIYGERALSVVVGRVISGELIKEEHRIDVTGEYT